MQTGAQPNSGQCPDATHGRRPGIAAPRLPQDAASQQRRGLRPDRTFPLPRDAVGAHKRDEVGMKRRLSNWLRRIAYRLDPVPTGPQNRDYGHVPNVPKVPILTFGRQPGQAEQMRQYLARNNDRPNHR